MKFSEQLRSIPSLSRLLDVDLEVEVVEGKPTSMKDMQNVTVSIPTEDFMKMTGDEIEALYLRPMVKALAKRINTMGNVKAAEIPLDTLPEDEAAFLCTNGNIPVLLRIVRRTIPTDRHQILIHALVQPENEDGS